VICALGPSRALRSRDRVVPYALAFGCLLPAARCLLFSIPSPFSAAESADADVPATLCSTSRAVAPRPRPSRRVAGWPLVQWRKQWIGSEGGACRAVVLFGRRRVLCVSSS
jgi:hypothetical protein